MVKPSKIPKKTRGRGYGLLYSEMTPRTIKVIPRQTGKPPVRRRGTRRAMLPGKRVSRRGKIYWELRRNRSFLRNDELKEEEENNKEK